MLLPSKATPDLCEVERRVDCDHAEGGTRKGRAPAGQSEHGPTHLVAERLDHNTPHTALASAAPDNGVQVVRGGRGQCRALLRHYWGSLPSSGQRNCNALGWRGTYTGRVVRAGRHGYNSGSRAAPRRTGQSKVLPPPRFAERTTWDASGRGVAPTLACKCKTLGSEQLKRADEGARCGRSYCQTP